MSFENLLCSCLMNALHFIRILAQPQSGLGILANSWRPCCSAHPQGQRLSVSVIPRLALWRESFLKVSRALCTHPGLEEVTVATESPHTWENPSEARPSLQMTGLQHWPYTWGFPVVSFDLAICMLGWRWTETLTCMSTVISITFGLCLGWLREPT